MKLIKGDVVGVCGDNAISNLIKIFERSPREKMSVIAHVGVISTDAYLENAMIIESLANGTVERNFSVYKRAKFYILRDRNLFPVYADKVVEKAKSYIGRKYGFFKIAAHFGDYFLGGKYFFRKLCKMDKYPICSWVVAHAYASIGVRFLKLDPDMVQPDDIWDYAEQAKWEIVEFKQ